MGKLGEFFFDNCTFFLSLVVPTTPSTLITGGYSSYHAWGTWAGDRILFLGRYSEDLPKGLLTNSQMCSSGENPADWLCEACTRVDLECNPYEYIRSFSRVWVLRNLSKREYVRSNGIPSERNGILVYDQDIGLDGNPGLCQVLLSRIGWSSDDSVSMCYKGPLQLHRGSWAGDRFDVRPFDDVIESMRDEGGWVDLTRTAARDIYDLFKSEYGHDEDFEEEPQGSDEE